MVNSSDPAFKSIDDEEIFGSVWAWLPGELPDIERLEDEGLLQRPPLDVDLDGALGIPHNDDQLFADAMELDEADEG